MRERSFVPETIPRVDRERAEASLAADAARYAQLAESLGASAARAVDAADVVIDDRVALKCCVPKCFEWGICANCPPHSPAPSAMRDLVGRYRQAVVFKLDVPTEVMLRHRDDKDRVGAYRKVFEIVGTVEASAFYDGHYLSAGFAAGSCKSVLCHTQDCAVLKLEECRHALVARPSMESASIDCFSMAEKLGWDMYPIGRSAGADNAQSAAVMGLVLIG